MKKLFKLCSLVVLASIGAVAIILAGLQIPYFKNKQENLIRKSIEQYIVHHSQDISDILAQNENFAAMVQKAAHIDETALQATAENMLHSSSDDVSASLTDENQIYKDHWQEITNNPISPSVGPQEAKVTVVEFFDFACGHCKGLAPIMSQIIKDNPDVRFIFEPLYFISEHSPYAAKVALAAHKKGKFSAVYHGIMTLPTLNEETINQILQDENLNVDEIKKMIEEKDIRRGLQDIDALSQVLGINGVPMLLINGEPFYGRSVAEIQNKINHYK